MRYVVWAVVAMAAYSVLPPLVKVGQTGMPSEAALFVVNGTLMVLLPALMLATGTPVLRHLSDPNVPYLVAAGVALTIALVAFYRGLSAGPVSVVVPIFGLFLVGSSVIGIVAFDEPLSARTALAVLAAVAAVYLASTG